MTTTHQTQAVVPDVRTKSGRPAFTLTEILVVIVLILTLLGITVVALNKILDSRARSSTVNILNQLQTAAAEYETQTNGQAVNHLTSVTTPIDWNAPSSIFSTDESASGKYDPKAMGALACYGSIPGKYISVDAGATPSSAAYRGFLGDLAGDLKETSVKRFIAGVWSVPSCKDIIQQMSKEFARSSPGIAEAKKPPNPDPVENCAQIGNAMLVDGLLEVRDAWGTKIVYAAYVKYPEPGGDLDKTDDFLPKRGTPFFVSAGPDRKFGSVGPSASPKEQSEAADNIYSFELD